MISLNVVYKNHFYISLLTLFGCAHVCDKAMVPLNRNLSLYWYDCLFPYVCINMNIRTSRGELSVKRYDSRRFSMHFLQVLFMPEWSKCLHDLEAFSSRSKTFASAQLDYRFQGQTPDEICDSADTVVVNSKRQAKYLCFLTDCKQIHIGFPSRFLQKKCPLTGTNSITTCSVV